MPTPQVVAETSSAAGSGVEVPVDGDAPDEQRLLFECNRDVPSLDTYARIFDIERRWIVPQVAAVEAASPGFEFRADWLAALDGLLSEEERNPPESSLFLAERATLAQFKEVVAQFAVDGLTEAQSFFPIVPRLPYRSHLAVLRVLIDEFGCGNVEQSHSQLYRQLLAELGLPTELDPYLDRTIPEVYAFVNLFHWLAARAPQPEYFLGALAYLESSILYAFKYFAEAANRLGLQGGRYYTEHLHIDNFHSREMRVAIRELEGTRSVDYRKVWTGVVLTSTILGAAVDATVELVRSSR